MSSEKQSEKFSVLMSVYIKENPAFFDLSLKSNLDDQTRKPDEFILVCDGPLNPGLDKVITKYQEKYPDTLKVYRTEKNQGLGKALNYGVSKCKYDIVLRSDSDDVCAKERFEKQVYFMESHPDISVCSSHIEEFDSDWHHPDKKKTLPLTNEDLYKMAKFRNPINHMAVAFRKKAILNVGSYRHILYIEDYELWVRVLINGYKLANIDDVLVYARVGNGMVGRRGNKQYISSWKELSRYMLQNDMINIMEYCRNMVSVRAFVYMPSGLKETVYKKLLRK